MGNCEKFKHFYCQVVEELRPKKKNGWKQKNYSRTNRGETKLETL